MRSGDGFISVTVPCDRSPKCIYSYIKLLQMPRGSTNSVNINSGSIQTVGTWDPGSPVDFDLSETPRLMSLLRNADTLGAILTVGSVVNNGFHVATIRQTTLTTWLSIVLIIVIDDCILL